MEAVQLAGETAGARHPGVRRHQFAGELAQFIADLGRLMVTSRKFTRRFDDLFFDGDAKGRRRRSRSSPTSRWPAGNSSAPPGRRIPACSAPSPVRDRRIACSFLAPRWDPEAGSTARPLIGAPALGGLAVYHFRLNARSGGGVSARSASVPSSSMTAAPWSPSLGERSSAGGVVGGGCTGISPAALVSSTIRHSPLAGAGACPAREAHGSVSLVMAPVADLDLEPKNLDRPDPRSAARRKGWGRPAEWITGARAGGRMVTAEALPGHGRTTADSHDTVPVVVLMAQRLRDQDEALRAAASGPGWKA